MVIKSKIFVAIRRHNNVEWYSCGIIHYSMGDGMAMNLKYCNGIQTFYIHILEKFSILWLVNLGFILPQRIS